MFPGRPERRALVLIVQSAGYKSMHQALCNNQREKWQYLKIRFMIKSRSGDKPHMILTVQLGVKDDAKISGYWFGLIPTDFIFVASFSLLAFELITTA